MNDLDLYNACMKYCQVFGNVVTHQSQLRLAYLTHDDFDVELLRRKVEVEEEWVKEEFYHLCEVIDKLKEVQKI